MSQWRRQDPNKNISGQVVVAVIAGHSVDEIIKQVGHRHRATTRDLAKALDHYGFLCPRRCVRTKDPKDMPRLALAQVHSNHSSRWHWVAIENGRVFDGVWGDAYGVVDWPSDFRNTCHVPIDD